MKLVTNKIGFGRHLGHTQQTDHVSDQCHHEVATAEQGIVRIMSCVEGHSKPCELVLSPSAAK